MHECLVTSTCSVGTSRVPQIRKDLSHPARANASVVGVLSDAHLGFPACRCLAGSPNAGAWRPSQGVLAIQSWTLRQAHPRAPPIPVAAPNWNRVGSARRSSDPWEAC